MPWLARRCAGNASRSTWPSSTLPRAGSAPISARINVVFPAPLRPIRPHISPSFTISEASRMIGIEPIETLRLSILSMAGSGLEPNAGDQLLHPRIIERLMRRAVGDDRAIVESEDTVGKPRDNFHVMFNKQNRDLSCFERRHDDLHQVEFFLDRNAAGGLVEH